MSFSRTNLKTDIDAMVSGPVGTTDFGTMANKAVIDVLSKVDMRSMIRQSALSPNLFDDSYRYGCPIDLKADGIIDIKPQIKRGRFDRWDFVTEEEFDRKKQDLRIDRYGDPYELKGTQWLGQNLVSISEDGMVRTLLLSRVIDDQELGIDSLDAVEDWEGYGQGENITKDSDNYVKGSACLNWDIGSGSGTTAGIYNDSLDTFDVSDYITNGSIFVWAYISSTTNLTNFIIRIGSSSSNYYYITITTNNEGASFYAGWNLLRFDFSDKTETGTVVDTACDYVALYMTKETDKVSETDYRFDNLVIKLGKHYSVVYYSKYGWQTATGSYLEKATDDTDILNVDTDEFNLISLKCTEHIERYILKNIEEADVIKRDYIEAETEYINKNPSKAMLLVQEYYNL